MELKVILQNSENGDVYDITSIVSDFQIESQLYGQAGKLTFLTQKDDIAVFEEGSKVQVYWKNKGIFMGYVFKRVTDRNGTIKVTIYDQLRYFKNKDIYINKGETLAETFNKICGKFNLKGEVMDDSGYRVPPKIHDDAAMYDVLQYSIDANLVGSKKRYIAYDDYGVIRLQDIDNMKTGYIFGDLSMVTDYQYEKSIDRSTYNRIKLTRPNKETKQYDNFIAEDSDNQKRWGILQFHKQVNENASDAVINDWCKNYLDIYNAKTERLSLRALAIYGDDDIWGIRAGSGIIIRIKTAIGDIAAQMYMIERCTHSMRNENYHTLSMEVMKVVATKQQEAAR